MSEPMRIVKAPADESPAALTWFLPSPAASSKLLKTIGTRRVSVAATSGAGKTFAAMRLLELLSEARSPFLVIDPVGNFWGLRVAKDGTQPGIDVPVLGGAHGDMALSSDAGAVVAEFVAKTPTSLILDVSRFDDDERARFVTALVVRLLELWSEKRRVFTLVLDEAQEFIPETLEKRGDSPMRTALKRFALTGRNFGLGLIMLTQAPQNVLKRVFNLADLLLVGRLGGDHERKAVERWVRHKGVSAKDALEDVPSLPAGTFYAWSPEWLQFFQKVRVTERWTFDASRTPELGGDAFAAGALASIDLKPLQRALSKLTDQTAPTATAPKASDGAAHDEALQSMQRRAEQAEEDCARLQDSVARMTDLVGITREFVSEMADRFEMLRARLLVEDVARPSDPPDVHRPERPDVLDLVEYEAREAERLRVAERTPRIERIRENGITTAVRIESPPHRRMTSVPAPTDRAAQPSDEYMRDLLATVARHGSMNRARLSILSGKSKTSSTFSHALRQLISEGLLSVAAGELTATALGMKLAKPAPLPLGRALYDYWMSQLGTYDQKTFEAVFRAGPRGLNRKELSERTGHSLTSSTFSQSVRRVIGMGLCLNDGGRIRIVEHVRKAMHA